MQPANYIARRVELSKGMNLRPFLAGTIILLAFGLMHSPAIVGAVLIQENDGAGQCTSAAVTSLTALNLTLCTSGTRYHIGETVVQKTLITNTGLEPVTFALALTREVSLRTDHHCFGFCLVTEEDSVQSLAPGATFTSTVASTASMIGPFLIKVGVFACPVGTTCFVSPDAFTTLTLRIVVDGPR